ncbi:MAG: UbiA family prenyltransferase [Chloroflexi bacterium]|jgi:geranylgeranylglycerol-phosphate geranylgeranyltransferase|nr:UbiA family prenyltransferase [Chloroflexota bacterium]MBT7080607.1 UbiA family prenyltransferase [Chloroflexota bacterium]MBT7289256.1 UbiA family prenyltransferase [Chloroflexota bacterium]
MKIKAFFKLIRIEYSLFLAVGVIIAGLLTGDLADFTSVYLLAFFIVFFVAVGSYAFNDFYDLEKDRENGMVDRPLVAGLLSPKTSVVTGIIAFTVVVVLAILLNSLFFAVAVLVHLPLFYLYNSHLKKVLAVKNAVIAYGFVALILLGPLVATGTLTPLVIYFAVMAFIVGFAFEVMLDIGDVDGDRRLGVNTIPVRFGSRRAAIVCVALYAVIMVMDPIPFFTRLDLRIYHDYVFLPLILISVLFYLIASIAIARNQSKTSVFKLKRLVFLTMQVACAAYLIGVFI